MAELQQREVNATAIELTSKRLKLQKMLSLFLIIAGGAFVWSATSAETDPTIGAWILAIGLVWYVTTRVRIWWHHH